MAVMRWLTRSWHGSGEHDLTDAEHQQAIDAYRAHNEVIVRDLPPALRVFAGERGSSGYVSLHDGRVEKWDLSPARDEFLLHLRCYDEHGGPLSLGLEYRGGIELLGASPDELRDWLDDPETEFLYDEIDVRDGGRFKHRYLLWPQGEFGVRFSDAAVRYI